MAAPFSRPANCLTGRRSNRLTHSATGFFNQVSNETVELLFVRHAQQFIGQFARFRLVEYLRFAAPFRFAAPLELLGLERFRFRIEPIGLTHSEVSLSGALINGVAHRPTPREWDFKNRAKRVAKDFRDFRQMRAKGFSLPAANGVEWRKRFRWTDIRECREHRPEPISERPAASEQLTKSLNEWRSDETNLSHQRTSSAIPPLAPVLRGPIQQSPERPT